MFNSTNITTGPSHVTVTEKKAPTDESVRLLREMEQAAEAKLQQSFRVAGCPMDLLLHTAHDPRNYQRVIHAHYRVGSVQYRVEHRVREDADRDEVIEGLVMAVARDLALNLLRGPITEAVRKHVRW